MKKKMEVSILLLTGLMSLTSCMRELKSFSMSDGGKQVTESRNLAKFEALEIYGSPTVYYTQADTFSVKVTGPENGVGNILTEVHDNVLTIRNRGKIAIVNITMSDSEATVYVTSPDLIAVQLNGSGDFISKNRVDTDNMKIVLRGSGNIEFADLICDRCTAELVGSGDIDVDRLVAEQSKLSLVGSGDIELRQWDVRETDVNLKGSGDVSVDFNGGCRLATCWLQGSGDITLRGHLEQYKGQKSGSGDIDTDKLSVEK